MSVEFRQKYFIAKGRISYEGLSKKLKKDTSNKVESDASYKKKTGKGMNFYQVGDAAVVINLNGDLSSLEIIAKETDDGQATKRTLEETYKLKLEKYPTFEESHMSMWERYDFEEKMAFGF